MKTLNAIVFWYVALIGLPANLYIVYLLLTR